MAEYVDAHWSDMGSPSNWRHEIPAIGLAALALGAGGRFAKSLLDQFRQEPEKAPASRLTEIPVEVSPEEAEELRRQGISVQRKLAEVRKGDPSYLGAAGIGALGTVSALGGWQLADKAIDWLRRRSAEQDRDRVRQRIQDLLNDEPGEEDEEVYGYMKAAEDLSFSRSLTKQAFGLRELGLAAALALGSGATLNLLSGYKQSRRESPGRQRLKAIRSYLRGRPTERSQLSMTPFVRGQLVDEEDEKELLEEVESQQPAQDEPTESLPPPPSPALAGLSRPAAQPVPTSKPAANWF